MNHFVEEEVLKERIFRVYSKEECNKYLGNRNYVTYEELVNINLMQFLMQRQEKSIRNEGKRNKKLNI